MYVWDDDDLNEEQKAAILLDENVLLIACPGSGKTRTLTYKVAHELSKIESTKKYVIAITYTNRAAEEIKERIERLGVRMDQLWIGTIHAFCMEWIIKPYYIYSEQIKHGVRVINPHEAEELLTELCAPYSAKRITHFDCNYLSTTEEIKLLCPKYEKHSDIYDILQLYWTELSLRKLVDFEQILRFSFELLRDNPFISKTLSKIFSNILIDEYQDTKDIQYQIFAKIFKAGRLSIRAFVVGDPNQSIYTTLGGYAISKRNLETMTSTSFKELTLSRNYRSSDIIIDYFDHYKTYDNSIIGCGQDKAYESIISYNKSVARDGLENEIVRLIKLNIEQKGIKPNEICIVGPQWVHLASLTRSLMVKLPDLSFDGPGMAPFAKDIDNFFYKICRIALTEPSPYLYVRRLRWSAEILEELNHAGIDVLKVTNKVFLKMANSINLIETDGITYLKAFFTRILSLLSIKLENHIFLVEHFNAFFESSQKRIDRLLKDGYTYISTVENFKKVFKQKDGITISTIHGVKGLEFNTVIAFALLEDYVPNFNDPNPADSAKKLLYVISSRAKRNLHIISERGRHKPFGSPPPELLPTRQLSLYPYIYKTC